MNTASQPKAEPVNQMLLAALNTGLEYAEEALIDYDQAYGNHPATKGGRGIITSDIAEIRAAIAAAEQEPQPAELSDVELNELADRCTSKGETGTLNYRKFARAVLAAQKEKATCSSDEWLANCPQSVRDLANKIKQEMK